MKLFIILPVLMTVTLVYSRHLVDAGDQETQDFIKAIAEASLNSGGKHDILDEETEDFIKAIAKDVMPSDDIRYRRDNKQDPEIQNLMKAIAEDSKKSTNVQSKNPNQDPEIQDLMDAIAEDSMKSHGTRNKREDEFSFELMTHLQHLWQAALWFAKKLFF